jgi:hypothetical protein
MCGTARESLIANFAVATGQVVRPAIGATRTEEDFSAHIAQTVAMDPAAGDVFLVDNLNTHQSESLVDASPRDAGSPAKPMIGGQARP